MDRFLPQKRNVDPSTKAASDAPFRVAFKTKQQRDEMRQKQKEEQALGDKTKRESAEKARMDFVAQKEVRKEKERLIRVEATEQERIQREKKRTRREGEMERQKGNSALASLRLLKLSPTDHCRHEQSLHAPQERTQIRSHYLGTTEKKQKAVKSSQKSKKRVFKFDWDASEDTALGDANPLYKKRVEPQLLFGRGFQGGIDSRMQRKQNNFYDTLVKRRMQMEGDTEMPERQHGKDRGRDADSCAHWSEKPLAEMTERDWKIFREDFRIHIKKTPSNSEVPLPIRTWREAPLNAQLLRAVEEQGYKSPTPVQMQAIPIGCQRRDMIGIAETGLGKTVAFVLPMLQYVMTLPLLNDQTASDGPYCFVLAPTRELAVQIDEETRKFADRTKIRTACVIGGVNPEVQGITLRQGVEVLVGTPGRIKDFIERSYIVFNQCNYVVIDEADRMIEEGFEEVVSWILHQLPVSTTTLMKGEKEDERLREELEGKATKHRLRHRVTSMFSATMTPAVEKIARSFLRNPVYMSIGDPGEGKKEIEQRIEFVPQARKEARLRELLNGRGVDGPSIVFVNQIVVAKQLERSLDRMMGSYSCIAIHGEKNQDERSRALEGFKEGEYTTLIATDVVGRGIHVPGVRLVVNFDMPSHIEQYTHRIGRTGRAGEKGTAVSFVTEDDHHLFYDLKQRLLESKNFVPHELSIHPATQQRLKHGQKIGM
uniref:RNA helicase n=1 Tax=Chromera velia CCMP2878 TaxID=1169474 RepID=A0A0G4I2C0_9ALVE|eukprot:Cvel_10351.t1-p1 / transcript=Cvel_10351.t1 / gene=Cvel_10351 / organism=Chromera_velia_CCMP2878 / gene_product=DEAD-box ATP-dependent RNA helicase 21, putative / transcript_product=DEAD-box ATP-dependent RNA helicase 21, putative / location=Cvel_scaffold622:31150-33282(-) / protein_length=711 / sequence_SO=supercontig / SO=protein_coding / is_pseudo=false